MALILLLLFLLIYVLFGTLADLLISTHTPRNYARITTKLIFRMYVAPVMFAFVVLYAFFSDKKLFNIVFACALLIGAAIRIFTTKGKFLVLFQSEGDQLHVAYLTPSLKRKSSRVAVANIKNIETTKANWIIDYPPALIIYLQKDTWEFQIPDRKLKSHVESEIKAATSNFSNAPASEQTLPPSTSFPS
jgi:hypothetical protein